MASQNSRLESDRPVDRWQAMARDLLTTIADGRGGSEAEMDRLRAAAASLPGPEGARVAHVLGRFELDGEEEGRCVAAVVRGALRISGAAPVGDDVRDRARDLAVASIMNELPYAIFWKDPDGVYLGCNRQFAETAGVEPSHVVGRVDLELPWTPSEARSFIRDDQAVLVSGEPKLNIEETQHQGDGRTRYLLTSKVPLLGPNGERLGVLGIFTDITSRRETELALEAAKAEAERAAEVKDNFLATMSHEIRTPLALITAPLEELIAQCDEGRERTLLERVQRNAARLEELVNDILDFVKSRASSLELRLERVEPRAFLEGLVEAHQPAAEAYGLELSLEVRGEGAIAADRRRLEKIVANLLSNALKFTPSGGQVAVVAAVEATSFTVEVRDTGPGIPPGEHERVFQRFQQVDSGTSRKHPGTGLGLALVDELVRLHGGRVTLESEVGRGASFRVEIPHRSLPVEAAPDSVEGYGFTVEVPRAPQSSPPPPTVETWVLVVEDHHELRAQIVESLDRYEVRSVADAPSALAMLEEAATLPSAVVSDFMMPGMDGLEFLAVCKGSPRTREVPFIILTARGDDELLDRVLAEGASDYVSKPFRVRELQARVRSAVDARVMQRELEAHRRQVTEARNWSNLARVLAQTAHEINNPMTVVKCNVELLDEWSGPLLRVIEAVRGLPPPEAVAQLAELRDSVELEDIQEELGDVVSSILESVARIQGVQQDLRVFVRQSTEGAGEARGLFQAVDTSKIAARVVQSLRRTIGPGVVLETELDPVATAKAHAHQLSQVIHNLVLNAIQAVGEDGHVVVATRSGDEGVTIAVRDDGPGLGEGTLEHCFDPFFTTKPFGLSTGLGLSVCRELVEGFGGRIRAVDHPDASGCTFEVWLPKAEAKS